MTRPILLLTGLVVAAAATAVWANMWKGSLTVLQVTVEGNRVLAASDVLALAKIPGNQELFSVDLFAARKRLEANPFIRSASVTREVPGTVRIAIIERRPVAALVLEQLVYVDKEAFVLPAARSEYLFDLPVITGITRTGDMATGRPTARADVRAALEILSAAEAIDDELARGISEVHIDRGNTMILYTAECGVPVIFGQGETGAKLLRFEAFWNEFVTQYGAAELECIDLRFEDLVVVRWNQGTRQAPTKTGTPSSHHDT